MARNFNYNETTKFLGKKKFFLLPWGKFEYQKLSMGLWYRPDIFQEKMNELFDLEYVRA